MIRNAGSLGSVEFEGREGIEFEYGSHAGIQRETYEGMERAFIGCVGFELE